MNVLPAPAALRLLSRDDLMSVMSQRASQVSDEQGFAALQTIAAQLGLEVVISRDEAAYPYGWDGRAFRVEPGPRQPEDLAHDLGHWLVASPDRRSLPEFGLAMVSQPPAGRMPNWSSTARLLMPKSMLPA